MTFLSKLAIELTYDLFLAAAEQEKEWADYLFKDGSMIGLNKDILVQYVEYIDVYKRQAIRKYCYCCTNGDAMFTEW